MRSFIVLGLFLLAVGCSTKSPVSEIELYSIDDETVRIDAKNNSLTVLFFLSPECPLCISYSLAMKQLAKEFQNDSVSFYGIHSRNWFSAEEVQQYALNYNLPFTMLLDNGNLLATTIGASVTPEVFVLNTQSEVIYSGKIDNWVNELGKKKLEVSEHYLKNALIAWCDGKSIELKRTEPKGCLIE